MQFKNNNSEGYPVDFLLMLVGPVCFLGTLAFLVFVSSAMLAAYGREDDVYMLRMSEDDESFW